MKYGLQLHWWLIERIAYKIQYIAWRLCEIGQWMHGKVQKYGYKRH